MKGNLVECFFFYPPLFPLIFTILFLILHLIFNFKHGAFVLKISFIFTALIIVVNYIVKLLT